MSSPDGKGYDQVGVDLSRVDTSNSIFMPKDIFEKLYLTPQTPVKGQLRNTFGNPTPLGLMGFLIATTPLVVGLMGWRGSGGGGAAIIGFTYFFGGLLQLIASIMEWLIGNTFPFVVFGSFGAFWLAFSATLTPYFHAVAAYEPGGAAAALGVAGFYSTFAFALCCIGVLVFFYLICALRTNVVFCLIFLTLTITAELLAAAYWMLALEKEDAALTLEKAGGGVGFVLCVCGWYLLLAQLLECVDFPFSLPVGDLSTIVPSGSSRRKAKEGGAKQNGA